MQTFDVLSRKCPIFGPHLLEASAGTGKTFSIEHVFLRLILESDEIAAEEILAVTFTRAATRDLKLRIRSNLEEARRRILAKEAGWEYLEDYLNVETRKLDDAILAFDRAQIYTIHGFCQRMLKEFAFEANLGFSLAEPDQKVPDRFYRAARKFLEKGIEPNLICPEQMAILLKEFDSMDDFAEKLIKKNPVNVGFPFSELLKRFQAYDRTPPPNLLDLFRNVRSSYRVKDGDLEAQVEALASGDPANAFRVLIREKGTLFKFLDSSNRKVRGSVECHPFFEWASQSFSSLIEEATDTKKLFGCLSAAWKQAAEPLQEEEQWLNFDEILKKMRAAIEKPPFATAVRNKYKAVIIDEFQDTDPIQWEIFKSLFLDVRAFYLVGDPKQSIYRFRKADIYTYYEAKICLGPASYYCLDTNYRSSSPLVGALNALFARDWLALPKLGKTIECPAVKSRSKANSDLDDGKGALHVAIGDSYEEGWLPFAVSEIERLNPIINSFSAFAILVKDRYQAEAALRLLQSRFIPAVAKSYIPLGKTLAFQAVREFFEALASLRNNAMRRTVGAGPFAPLSLNESLRLVEEKGLIPLCRDFASCAPDDLEFQKDLNQIVEQILAWEAEMGFSFPGLLRFLNTVKSLDAEEGGRRNLETDADAVQILTGHASKGLEFDIVFALGIAGRPPKAEEEAEEAAAEALRQLYVAMTRAKRRLYIPLPRSGSGKSPSLIELFCQKIEEQEGAILPYLAKIPNVTTEEIEQPLVLGPPARAAERAVDTAKQPVPETLPSFLHSFTSLARPVKSEGAKEKMESEGFTVHTIPRGTETGTLIHTIFERLFSSQTSLWKDIHAVQELVRRQLENTPLAPWETPIQEMVWNALNLPLFDADPFKLADLEPGEFQVEMEFLYYEAPNWLKGFIDLAFMHEGKFYILDWKTNWLGTNDEAYRSLEGAMAEHDYFLQAKLYKEALRRHVKQFYIEPFEDIFGGAVYLFLRGGRVCRFNPK